MKSTVLVIAMLSMGLAGCSDTPSPEEMKNDRKLLRKTINECNKLGNKAIEQQKCLNTLKAMQLIMQERFKSRR